MITAFRLMLLLFIVSFTTGCTVNFKNVGLTNDGNAYAKSLTFDQKKSIKGLRQAILQLDLSVDPKEATDVAYNAVVYPMYLTNKYNLVWPPSLQNIFVNSGIRQRGLCYQWTTDMLKHLRAKNYRTVDFTWTIANRAKHDEHNSAVVVAKGKPWYTGILLDPWRNSGNLYWKRVTDDPKYKWSLYEDWKKKLGMY